MHDREASAKLWDAPALGPAAGTVPFPGRAPLSDAKALLVGAELRLEALPVEVEAAARWGVLVVSVAAVSGTVFVVPRVILPLAQVEVHYIAGDQQYHEGQYQHGRQDRENARLTVRRSGFGREQPEGNRSKQPVKHSASRAEPHSAPALGCAAARYIPVHAAQYSGRRPVSPRAGASLPAPWPRPVPSNSAKRASWHSQDHPDRPPTLATPRTGLGTNSDLAGRRAFGLVRGLEAALVRTNGQPPLTPSDHSRAVATGTPHVRFGCQRGRISQRHQSHAATAD